MTLETNVSYQDFVQLLSVILNLRLRNSRIMEDYLKNDCFQLNSRQLFLTAVNNRSEFNSIIKCDTGSEYI